MITDDVITAKLTKHKDPRKCKCTCCKTMTGMLSPFFQKKKSPAEM
jgi:hypothetical protein